MADVATEQQERRWQKSSYTGSAGNCVEVDATDDPVYVRDSKDPNGPVVCFTRVAWTAFIDAIKHGDLEQ